MGQCPDNCMISLHIQPLVEIYHVLVVCISSTTACNLTPKNVAKASGQSVMGTWDHLLCASLKKLIFIFYSQENYSMYAFFCLLQMSKLSPRDTNN